MMYILVLCIGSSGIEEYNMRKELLSKQLVFKRLNKQMKFYFSKNIDKSFLQGNIAIVLLNKLDNIFEIIERIINYKNYVIIGVVFKNKVYSIEFLKEVILNNKFIGYIINKNLLNISNINERNNIILLKNVNNKSSN